MLKDATSILSSTTHSSGTPFTIEVCQLGQIRSQMFEGIFARLSIYHEAIN